MVGSIGSIQAPPQQRQVEKPEETVPEKEVNVVALVAANTDTNAAAPVVVELKEAPVVPVQQAKVEEAPVVLAQQPKVEEAINKV